MFKLKSVLDKIEYLVYFRSKKILENMSIRTFKNFYANKFVIEIIKNVLV